MGKRYIPTDSDFKRLVVDIAAALGDGWTVEQAAVECDQPRATLTHSTDGEIGFYSGYGDDGKLVISGRFPHSTAVGRPEGSHSIGVSPARGAAAIAKEISRRLLPDYTVARAAYLERIASHDAYVALSLANAKKLATVAGTDVRREYGSGVLKPAFYVKGGPDVEVHGKSVYFQRLSVSVDVAAQILKLLVKAQATQEAKDAAERAAAEAEFDASGARLQAIIDQGKG